MFSPISHFGPAPLLAVPMTSDPGGFLNIPWKSSLEGRVDLSKPEGEGRVKEYNLVRTPSGSAMSLSALSGW
jgi:hypothetical protein